MHPDTPISMQVLLLRGSVRHVILLLEDPPPFVRDVQVELAIATESVNEYVNCLQTVATEAASEPARRVARELRLQLRQLFPCGTSVKEWKPILASVLAAEAALRRKFEPASGSAA